MPKGEPISGDFQSLKTLAGPNNNNNNKVYYLNNKSTGAKFVGDKRLFKAFFCLK